MHDWDAQARDGYAWWVARLGWTARLVDIVRIDHFRGFEAYYEIDGKATTAKEGRWVKGPGANFFVKLQERIGELALIAENLGVITPPVEDLGHRFGLPGMAVLQFAFGADPQAPDFRPHNYPRDRVVYTGTHDNDTIVGWWTSSDVGASTRTQSEMKAEREYALKYLASDGTDIHWAFIRAALGT